MKYCTKPVPLLILILGFLVSSRANASYYVTTNDADLGQPNEDAAAGNPLKGFLTNPDWSSPPYLDDIPSSLEFYYIGLNQVMTGLNTFDWDTYLEPRLSDTASRNKHTILRFVLDTPSKATYVPQFLIDGALSFNSYETYGGGQSPDYTDENLLVALEQFIAAFGARYDADPRLGFVQVGLLGFWGEWHTYTGDSATTNWIPDSTRDRVVTAFDSAFSVTRLQVRYPYTAASEAGFGLHDDSFAHSTVLDGALYGGADMSWFFWPRVQSAGVTDFWKTSVMGGELRPELQSSIFSESYPTGTDYHQDFNLCVDTTHATYSLNYHAFATGYTDSNELDRAKAANNRMGYSFRVTKVEVSESSVPTEVEVAVTVTQTGVAPFYYPLNLTLSCAGGTLKSLPGVEAIINNGDISTFNFINIPSTLECLDEIKIGLASNYAYLGNPIKFAQGITGDTHVTLGVPLPPQTTPSPITPQPTQNPTSATISPDPTQNPTPAPTTSEPTTLNPTSSPVTSEPTQNPTSTPITQTPTHNPTKAPTTPQPTPNTGCATPCTSNSDCYGDGSTGGDPNCGNVACVVETGLCSFNAWKEECSSFVECNGNDALCTLGPLNSAGTCTGFGNNECIYQYCYIPLQPITPEPTSFNPTPPPVTPQPTQNPTFVPTTSSPTVVPATPQPTQNPTPAPTTSEPTTLNPTSSPVTSEPTQNPTSTPITQTPTQNPTKAPTTPQPTPNTGCATPCTSNSDCYGDGSTGGDPNCGNVVCVVETGLCSFNAWDEQCSSFVECNGNDALCTLGPLNSAGTCTGFGNNECIYQYCHTPSVCLSRGQTCTVNSDCCSNKCRRRNKKCR